MICRFWVGLRVDALLERRRKNRSRADTVNTHTVFQIIGSHSAGERQNCALRGGISRTRCNALDGDQRSNIGDTAFTDLQMRHCRLAGQINTRHIDCHDMVPCRQVCLFDTAADNHTCTVDQNIQSAKLLCDHINHMPDLLWVLNIRLHKDARISMCADFLCYTLC